MTAEAEKETRSHIQTLLDHIQTGKRPDYQAVCSFIGRYHKKMPEDLWESVVDVMCPVYRVNEGQLHEAIQPVTIRGPHYINDFEDLVPPVGWLNDYVEFTRGQESPTAYHFFTGLVVLGAALKRQVWVDMGHFKIFPCIQTLLIGPSGKTFKSTAANIGVDLALESERIYMLPKRVTEERLLTLLAQRSKTSEAGASAMMYVSELSTFLSKKDYQQGVVETLTDLFDSPSHYVTSTQKREEEKLRNVALSFIGCSNEEWLAHSIPLHALGGGFMGRILAIYQGGTDRCKEIPDPPNMQLFKKLVASLRITEGVTGKADLSPQAKKFYKTKYKWLRNNFPEDERLAPFWERYSVHLLRLGMLLSISRDLRQFGSVDIDDDDLQEADDILKWIFAKLPLIYSYLGTTDFGEEAQRVMRFISRSGGSATDGQIRRKMSRRMNKSKLEECLRTLEAARWIKPDKTPGAWDGDIEWTLKRNPEEF